MFRLWVVFALVCVPVLLSGQNTAAPVSAAEYGVITAQSDNLRILSIFDRADSIVLRSPSLDVDVSDTIWNYLARRMYRAAKNEGVGIAAPQVGINRRVICVQRWDKPEVDGEHPWEFYFNPRISKYSGSVARRNDGCLSVPDGTEFPNIEGFSYRATWVKIAYYDANGVFHKEKVNHQYTAHIFQHEIDHLDGIMFFDRQQKEKAVCKLNNCSGKK